MLDQCLDFHLQVEKVVGKVKRATNKVGMLFKERSGIPVKIATDLYKSLIMRHRFGCQLTTMTCRSWNKFKLKVYADSLARKGILPPLPRRLLPVSCPFVSDLVTCAAESM